jgi:hypothetical protein
MLLALVHHDDAEEDREDADRRNQERQEATQSTKVPLRLSVVEKVCEL